MDDKPVPKQIDDIIAKHGGWKSGVLIAIRAAALQADAEVTEEIKWRMATRPEGLPVWMHGGIICFAETWKDNIKLLFPKGARVNDVNKLFNTRMQSATLRGIEYREGDVVDQSALTKLIIEAIKANK